MQFNETRLREKGWSDAEIEHARSIWEKAKANRSTKHILTEQLTYWILLVLLVGGAIAGAWTAIPFLLILSPIGADIAIGIIGLLFGSLASVLINDLEHLKNHHHVLISLVIPISTVIASIILYNQLFIITRAAQVPFEQNPIIVSAIFAITSMIPYIIVLLKNKSSEKVPA